MPHTDIYLIGMDLGHEDCCVYWKVDPRTTPPSLVLLDHQRGRDIEQNDQKGVPRDEPA